jgi:hypothetical protein
MGKSISGSEQGIVAHTCNSSYLRGGGRRIVSLRSVQEKLGRTYLKNKIKTKRLARDMA